jgi:hypothetical protein
MLIMFNPLMLVSTDIGPRRSVLPKAGITPLSGKFLLMLPSIAWGYTSGCQFCLGLRNACAGSFVSVPIVLCGDPKSCSLSGLVIVLTTRES